MQSAFELTIRLASHAVPTALAPLRAWNAQVEQKRAAMRLQLAADNEAAAQTSKQTYSTLYKETYVNHIDDDFYKRFGTSAR